MENQKMGIDDRKLGKELGVFEIEHRKPIFHRCGCAKINSYDDIFQVYGV